MFSAKKSPKNYKNTLEYVRSCCKDRGNFTSYQVFSPFLFAFWRQILSNSDKFMMSVPFLSPLSSLSFQSTVEDILPSSHVLPWTIADILPSSHVLLRTIADILLSSHVLQRTVEDILLFPHVLQRTVEDILPSLHVLKWTFGDMQSWIVILPVSVSFDFLWSIKILKAQHHIMPRLCFRGKQFFST